LFLRTLINPQGVDQVFVCGPHAFNDEAEVGLKGAGIAEERIHYALERLWKDCPSIPLDVDTSR
jgi:ferredoxin-NADP reductase